MVGVARGAGAEDGPPQAETVNRSRQVRLIILECIKGVWINIPTD